jgi:hypothetical protein
MAEYSNFPIALFLSNRPDVEAIVGASDPSGQTSVLGLLIDETLPVENCRTTRRIHPNRSQFDLRKLKAWERIQRLISTTTDAHDNMAIAASLASSREPPVAVIRQPSSI